MNGTIYFDCWTSWISWCFLAAIFLSNRKQSVMSERAQEMRCDTPLTTDIPRVSEETPQFLYHTPLTTSGNHKLSLNLYNNLLDLSSRIPSKQQRELLSREEHLASLSDVTGAGPCVPQVLKDLHSYMSWSRHPGTTWKKLKTQGWLSLALTICPVKPPGEIAFLSKPNRIGSIGPPDAPPVCLVKVHKGRTRVSQISEETFICTCPDLPSHQAILAVHKIGPLFAYIVPDFIVMRIEKLCLKPDLQGTWRCRRKARTTWACPTGDPVGDQSDKALISKDTESWFDRLALK